MTAEDFREADEYRAIIANDPCVYCGNPTEQIDHIKPIAGGGSDRWDNYAASCQPCNLSKYTTPLLLFLARGGFASNRGTLEERIYARRC
ncbi:HNH endonuclease [Streptomyces sp. NPDC093269]|uniref:HNH endonuclease n=1 Tax=Streptomyces sp. NPDC093269 TaxID=3366038 RepID=UPI0037FE60FC